MAAPEYRPEFNRMIASQTHCLQGRIRIVEIEYVCKETGKSQRYRAQDIFASVALSGIAREVSKRPNLFNPTQTDGGLRFMVEAAHATWFVYSW